MSKTTTTRPNSTETILNKFCPYCGGSNVHTFICEWEAASHDDMDNLCDLDEHQCIDCDYKSFWT